MLFGKKTPGKIFKQHYKSALAITKNSRIPHNAEFELLPALFVLCDYAAASTGKDRCYVADSVVTEIKKLYRGFNSTEFDARCDLYGEIIRNGNLRGEWLMGNVDALNKNIVSKTAVLLGDILCNPACAKNYYSAPYMVHDITEVFGFAESVMKPLISEFINLFNSICTL